MKIIVACGGKWHSFALVEQLLAHNHEVLFFTPYSSIVNSFAKSFVTRIDTEKIPPSVIRTHLGLALLLRLFRSRFQWPYRLFDFWTANSIRNIEADFFIGWSGMSLRSVRRAQSKGMITVVERGSVHIELQNFILREAYAKLGRRFEIQPKVRAVENIEYTETNYLAIPSMYCFQSFIDRGFSESKLWIHPLGASPDFIPVLNSGSSRARFLFLGQLSFQKGVHLLLEAFAQLESHHCEFELVLCGALDSDFRALLYRYLDEYPSLQYRGFVQHQKLPHLIRQFDMSVVPSIQDGFAMVVPQCMKVGLPVLVSRQAGASELVKEGVNGWIINPSVDEIYQRLKWAIHHLDELKYMRSQIIAQLHRASYSWNSYGSLYHQNLQRAVSSEA